MTAEPINKEPTRRLFTVDEYYRLAEAGILAENDRVELVEGEIIEMAPIGSRHAAHVKRLISLLTNALDGRAIVAAQDPIRLDRFSEPEPDIALLRSRDDFYASAHPGSDDIYLIIEVADSSLEYDRSTKVPLYARFGVPNVWLLDLQDQQVECYASPEGAAYSETDVLDGDDQVELESLGLSFVADDLFVNAGR